ncbi:nucleotidyltransferase family protein [Pseudalkalibacillus decolorationis]|uniref:nucleotidyltransferase family protein n=1 Tax=Pseudalkalibacillus decolorationis TaxID=163879 RepID=UPI002147E6CC|nr:nucleotidyltransferase family protein [Pseudalkalibacillus decolorationis]
MSMFSELQNKKHEILQLARQHGIIDLRIFGSVVRLEENQNSDIDFLVRFEEDRSLFDLIRFKQEVEVMLSKPVDVVTEESVHYTIKSEILNEAIQL